MSILFHYRYAAFRDLRRELGLSDGNLAAHLSRLVDAGYATRRTVFTGARFEPRFEITAEGKRAFELYREALRRIVYSQTESPPPPQP